MGSALSRPKHDTRTTCEGPSCEGTSPTPTESVPVIDDDSVQNLRDEDGKVTGWLNKSEAKHDIRYADKGTKEQGVKPRYPTIKDTGVLQDDAPSRTLRRESNCDVNGNRDSDSDGDSSKLDFDSGDSGGADEEGEKYDSREGAYASVSASSRASTRRKRQSGASAKANLLMGLPVELLTIIVAKEIEMSCVPQQPTTMLPDKSTSSHIHGFHKIAMAGGSEASSYSGAGCDGDTGLHNMASHSNHTHAVRTMVRHRWLRPRALTDDAIRIRRLFQLASLFRKMRVACQALKEAPPVPVLIGNAEIVDHLSKAWPHLHVHIRRNHGSQAVDRARLGKYYYQSLRQCTSPNVTSVELGVSVYWYQRRGETIFGRGLSADAHFLETVVAKNKALTGLDLSRLHVCSAENLGQLIDAIAACEGLERLNLGSKRLKQQHVNHICRIISENKSMRFLRLSHNTFTRTGGEQLADSLRKNRSLVELNLNDCQLQDGVGHIVDAIAVHPSLESLDIGSNAIESSAGSKIGDAIKRNTTLRNFYIFDSFLGSIGVEPIAEALCFNRTLCSLVIGYNGIGNEGCIALMRALEVNQTLTYLCLRGNNINTEGAVAVSKALCTNRSLRHIDLATNPLHEGVNDLATSLKENTTLESLDLSRTSLTDVTRLSQAMSANIGLRTLKLAFNLFEHNNIVDLERGLLANRTLTELNLASNFLCVEGIFAVGRLLAQSTSLRKLCLAKCGDLAEDGGLVSIVDAILSNTRSVLSHLDLSRCEIGDTSIGSLFKLLTSNKTLATLKLRGNILTDISGVALLSALSHNTTLNDMDVSDNAGITIWCECMLRKALRAPSDAVCERWVGVDWDTDSTLKTELGTESEIALEEDLDEDSDANYANAGDEEESGGSGTGDENHNENVNLESSDENDGESVNLQ